MENKTLLDFDKSDKLRNYLFESPFIKFWDLSFDTLFESKERLSIKRVIKGKDKKSKLVIVVEQEWACKEENNEQFNGGGQADFNSEQEAVEFFLSQVNEAKFFIEKNKENIVFDNFRYFWRINDKNERLERVIC